MHRAARSAGRSMTAGASSPDSTAIPRVPGRTPPAESRKARQRLRDGEPSFVQRPAHAGARETGCVRGTQIVERADPARYDDVESERSERAGAVDIGATEHAIA